MFSFAGRGPTHHWRQASLPGWRHCEGELYFRQLQARRPAHVVHQRRTGELVEGRWNLQTDKYNIQFQFYIMIYKFLRLKIAHLFVFLLQSLNYTISLIWVANNCAKLIIVTLLKKNPIVTWYKIGLIVHTTPKVSLLGLYFHFNYHVSNNFFRVAAVLLP